MNIEELLVGGVAITLGVGGVIISIGNWDTCYRSSKVLWIESMGGRTAARWTYAVVGILLVILGIAIALGFGPNATEPQAQNPSAARIDLITCLHGLHGLQRCGDVLVGLLAEFV